MGIGVSILLLAVGAILAFAVHVVSNGFDLNTIGVILMVIGGIGLLTALLVSGMGGWSGGFRRTTTTYVEDGGIAPAAPATPVARRRRVVRDTYVP